MRYNDPARGGIAGIRCIEQGAYQLTPNLWAWNIARRQRVQYLFDAARATGLQNPFGECRRRINTQFGAIHGEQCPLTKFFGALRFLPEAAMPETTVGVPRANRRPCSTGNSDTGAIG